MPRTLLERDAVPALTGHAGGSRSHFEALRRGVLFLLALAAAIATFAGAGRRAGDVAVPVAAASELCAGYAMPCAPPRGSAQP